MTAEDERPSRRRVRDPELHRRAIVSAAATTFGERGYQRATLREIARRAGVTHGLVLRHFGSKENLFLLAVPGTRDLAHVAEGPLDTLPERIAAGFIDRMEHAEGTDPFLAMLRSATTDEGAASRLLVAMQESSASVYRGLLGDDSIREVVPFLASLLIGVTFTRYILRAGVLAEMDTEELRRHLERCIRAIVTVPTAGS